VETYVDTVSKVYSDNADLHLVTILDAARYIVHKIGRIGFKRLQILCYYSQAWTLAWTEIPLFDDDFLAHPSYPYNAEIAKFYKEEDSFFTTEISANTMTLFYLLSNARG
jgi:uncharacterized phage-associated protein